MPVFSMVAVYFVVWWLCLFLVLPFREGRSQVDAGDVFKGSEPGAPAVPQLWQRLLVTTLLAAIITGLLFWGLSNPLLREYWR